MFLEICKDLFVAYEDVVCFQFHGTSVTVRCKSQPAYSCAFMIKDSIAFLQYLGKTKKANNIYVISLEDVEKEFNNDTLQEKTT